MPKILSIVQYCIAVKQCYQTGQFQQDKNWWKMSTFKCDILSNFQTMCVYFKSDLKFFFFFNRYRGWSSNRQSIKQRSSRQTTKSSQINLCRGLGHRNRKSIRCSILVPRRASFRLAWANRARPWCAGHWAPRSAADQHADYWKCWYAPRWKIHLCTVLCQTWYSHPACNWW